MGELDMKQDWNRRAQENAEFYIATSIEAGEAAFDASGQSDVRHFFDGLEHLLHPAQDVVDLGCGIGRMDRHVAPRVRSLTGVDVSGEMVRRATARLGDLPNVRFVEVDGWSFRPLEDACAGLLFSHIVLQHTPRAVTRSYLRDARRILRPGGSFVFQIPEAVPGAPEDPPEEDTFEMRYWAEDALRTELEGLGFRWVECRRFPVECEEFAMNYLRIHVQRPDSDGGSVRN
jgi:SAM-dependent methyltransferase